MGYIAEVIGGGTPPTTDPDSFRNGNIPWVTPADLSRYTNKFIGRGARDITKRGLDNSGARLVPPGTILFSSRAPIGYVAIAANQLSTSQGFKNFVLYKGISPDYIYYYLKRAKDLAIELSSGTTFLEISGEKAKLIPVSIAPFAEQRRIVAEIEKQFSRLDVAFEILRRLERNLERLRTATLKAAVEGRLVQTESELARDEGRDYEPADVALQKILRERRAQWEADQLAKTTLRGKPPRDKKSKTKYQEPAGPNLTDFPTLPEGWTWALTQQLGKVQLGRQRSPKHRSKNYPTKYIRAANITEKGLDLSDVLDMEFEPDERERYRLQVGDIVLSEASGSPGQVGKPAMWRGEIKECCFQNTVIRVRPYRLLGNYLLIVFKHFYFTSVFAKLAGGVGINHLGAERFSNLAVPLPPFAEQERMVADVERRLSVIEELESTVKTNLRRAKSLHQAIFRRAFAGELVPQDPDDEPAAVLLERIHAEKQQREGQRKQKRRTSRSKMKAKEKSLPRERRPLIEVIRNAQQALRPEELFREAGFQPDEVEAFYAELKEADRTQAFVQVIYNNGDVFLKFNDETR